jgi:UDP-2,3-diacylglucosamine pyrophosphatase LpxH
LLVWKILSAWQEWISGGEADMAGGRRVFISDIHMSTGISLEKQYPYHQYDWLTDDQANLVISFLDYIAKDEDGSVDELVLVGDIFDDWVYPMTDRPPQYSKIATARFNPQIIEHLLEIAKEKKVFYLKGNHDMTIDKGSISNLGDGNITFLDKYKTRDGLYAEHGHRFSMYNARDCAHTLPIGYYISRLQATVDKGTAGAPQRWQETFKGAPESMTKLSLDQVYIDAPLHYYRLKLSLDDNSKIEEIGAGEIDFGGVREKYEDLPGRWKECDITTLWESAELEIGKDLTQEAKRIANSGNGTKLIVFGHTHRAQLEPIFRPDIGPVEEPVLTPIAIYANCGSWCERNAEYAYIVDDYDEAGHHTVTRMSWPEKKTEGGPLTI